MARLRKIDVTLTKDYTSGDTRQIPFAGTVQVYKQGIVYVSGGGGSIAGGATNVSLTVRNTGRVVVGDTLVKESDIIAGTASPPTVTVDQITQPTTVRVDHTSGGTMTLTGGDRLIITSNAPTLYSESSANLTVANPFVANATTGYGAFYAKEAFVDVKLAGSGATTQVVRDLPSGESARGVVVYASDFATVQQAINALPPGGGTVMLTEMYDVTSYAPVLIETPGVRLVGGSWIGQIQESPGSSITPETGLKVTTAGTNVLRINNAPYCSIENLNIIGGRSGDTYNSAGIGILVEYTSPYTITPGLTMRRVMVKDCAGDGMKLINGYLATFDYCQFAFNNGKGFNHSGTSPGSPHQLFLNCWFLSNKNCGYWGDEVGIMTHIACSYQDNGRGLSAHAEVAASQSFLSDSGTSSFYNCQWEVIDSASSRIGFEGYRLSNLTVEGCSFINDADSSLGVSKGMLFHDLHTGRIQNNFFNRLPAAGGSAGIALHLVADGAGNESRDVTIGNFWTPNGNIKFLDGTEGTDFREISISQTQQYADDTARDLAVGTSQKYPPFKVKGQIIYVRTPTSPTNKLQYWDGSAWQNV